MSTKHPLPKFDRPPLTEVVQGVQFNNLQFQATHVGSFYERIRSRFPTVNTLPPIAPVFERYEAGVPGGLLSFPQSMFPSVSATPRVWFNSADEVSLIQLQADRLLFNWRRRNPSDKYLHYETVRENFVSAYRDLQAFCAAEGLGPIVPNQCELSYINSIPNSPETPADNPQIVFPHLSKLHISEGAVEEDFAYTARLKLLSDDGVPIGRIHINLGAGTAPDGTRGLSLELTVRGAPLAPEMDGVLAFHDLAHQTIVNTFVDITSESAQTFWGRFQ